MRQEGGGSLPPPPPSIQPNPTQPTHPKQTRKNKGKSSPSPPPPIQPDPNPPTQPKQQNKKNKDNTTHKVTSARWYRSMTRPSSSTMGTAEMLLCVCFVFWGKGVVVVVGGYVKRETGRAGRELDARKSFFLSFLPPVCQTANAPSLHHLQHVNQAARLRHGHHGAEHADAELVHGLVEEPPLLPEGVDQVLCLCFLVFFFLFFVCFFGVGGEGGVFVNVGLWGFVCGKGVEWMDGCFFLGGCEGLRWVGRLAIQANRWAPYPMYMHPLYRVVGIAHRGYRAGRGRRA